MNQGFVSVPARNQLHPLHFVMLPTQLIISRHFFAINLFQNQLSKSRNGCLS